MKCPISLKRKKDCRQSNGAKGGYLTIKKDGTRRCYKSEKQYKAAQAWAHEGNKVSDSQQIREFVRNILMMESSIGRKLDRATNQISRAVVDILKDGGD